MIVSQLSYAPCFFFLERDCSLPGLLRTARVTTFPSPFLFPTLLSGRLPLAPSSSHFAVPFSLRSQCVESQSILHQLFTRPSSLPFQSFPSRSLFFRFAFSRCPLNGVTRNLLSSSDLSSLLVYYFLKFLAPNNSSTQNNLVINVIE